MNERMISNDFLEIITGTTNKLHPVYVEAAKNIDSNNEKCISYIKKFIPMIENIANKKGVKDERISSSNGNIRKFKIYEDIKSSIEFLKKNITGVSVVNDLSSILKCLEVYQPLYTEAYEKNIRLVVLEYESAVDLLVTGIALVIAENVNVVQSGTNIKIKKNKTTNNGIFYKTISDMAKQLYHRTHEQYLDEMVNSKKYTKIDTNIKESVSFMESAVGDTVQLIDTMLSGVGKIAHYTVNIVRTIKNSIFGIVPLIRSCLYLRYKKKADTILALEQQVDFINQNIEHLQNRTNIDPEKKEEIIKKQQAKIEEYQKKAAKLRAQLTDTENSAADAIKSADTEIQNSKDDDFILEGGSEIKNFFQE